MNFSAGVAWPQRQGKYRVGVISGSAWKMIFINNLVKFRRRAPNHALTSRRIFDVNIPIFCYGRSFDNECRASQNSLRIPLERSRSSCQICFKQFFPQEAFTAVLSFVKFDR